MVVILKHIKTIFLFVFGGFLFYLGGVLTKNKELNKKEKRDKEIINNLKNDAKIKDRISKLSFGELSNKLLSKQRSGRIK